MSISEKNNGGKEAASRQSADVNITTEIEEALNFLDSEEYQDVGVFVSDTKPSTTGINAAQVPQQKDSTALEPQHKKGFHPKKNEKEPTKKAPTPLEGEKNKNSGKIWLLTLSVAIVIFLAVLFFYKRG